MGLKTELINPCENLIQIHENREISENTLTGKTAFQEPPVPGFIEP